MTPKTPIDRELIEKILNAFSEIATDTVMGLRECRLDIHAIADELYHEIKQPLTPAQPRSCVEDILCSLSGKFRRVYFYPGKTWRCVFDDPRYKSAVERPVGSGETPLEAIKAALQKVGG